MLPRLRKLEHEFPEELVVIGVHSAKFPAERDNDNLRKAVLRNEISHAIVNDAEFAIWQHYAVRAWPALMFVDPHGYVIGKHEGEFELSAVREFVRGAISAFGVDGELDRRAIPLRLETEETGLLRFPGKVLVDPERSRLFIADTGHHRIVITDLDGNVHTVVGDCSAGLVDGSRASARLSSPQGMAIDRTGRTLYVADAGNHAIRAIDLEAGEVATVAGTGERAHSYEGGPGRQTALASPWDLAWLDGSLWIAMAGMHQLWTFDPSTGNIMPSAGSGHESIHDGPLISAAFAQPSGITALNGQLYVADSETSAIRHVDPESDRVRRLVGRGLFEFGDVDAMGDSVRLQHPLGVAATLEGGEPVVYIADSYNDKIKRLRPSTREVVTVFGGAGHGLVDGDAVEAEFWEPGSLSLRGRTLYIADTNNHAVRIADLDTGIVRSLEIKGL